jgi:hypothetical protein
MAELRATIVGENKSKKAFDQVSKSTSGLEKGVKKLGIALAATFGAQQLLKFGKNAAKAFIEDEKAATRLAQSVKNLGLAFEVPRIEKFISELSRASGVTDDQLRPAMQKLLTTTGSVAKSQELLTQALDTSRGSGVDYETVVNDLSMAYVGNTKGLKKYGLGLTNAELKTMSFADVQEKLSKQFSGSNAAYLETYAGQMSILSNVAGEASETIGKSLIDSLMILSGDTTVEDLAVTMENLASNTANAITEIAKLGKGVANFFSESYGKTDSLADKITDFLDRLTGNSDRITRRNVGRAGRSFGGGSGGAGGNIETPEQKAQRLKREAVEAAAAKRNKELAAMQKKSLDTQKKQNALTKASKTLNLEAIGIEAALKGKISETDRLSLLLQKAILEGNATLATQLSDQLEAAITRNNALKASLLATPEAPNPFRNWKVPDMGPLGGLAAGVIAGVNPSPQGTTPGTPSNPLGIPYGGGGVIPNYNLPENSYSQVGPMGGLAAGVIAGVNPVVNVTVVLDNGVVANAVSEVQTNNNLSGSFTTVGGRGANTARFE